MKNTIGILLLLLLLLIGTCIYQKTYTIYALTHAEDQNTTNSQKKKQDNEPVRLKAQVSPVQNTSLTEIETKQNTVNVPVHSLTSTGAPKEHASKKVSEHVSIEAQGMETNATQEPSILEKIKSSVISALSSDEKETEDKKIIKKETSINPTINTENKEKEVVDYLLTVQKERDSALTNRDEAETKLQSLIKKVLEDRQLVISDRENNALTLEKEHNDRLKERDVTAQAIYKKHTEEKGK